MKINLHTIGLQSLEYIKKARLILILFVALLFLDLFSKWLVVFLWNGSASEVIPNFLYIYYIRNYNAAFGSSFGLNSIFGEDGIRWFFIVFTILVVLCFCVLLYIWRDKRKFGQIAVLLIIVGGIGNLYDRMIFGYVRDFVHFVYFGLDIPLLGTDFAIFNIADSFLSIGIVLFAWYVVFMYERDKQRLNSKKSLGSNE
ncbi:MAG: signal peptidase II [Firmicutes bacterium]|nr:signal peptidase II [Bacillota bacterium]MCL1954154.1 signal peptidase II [Bacillota bacterium]